MTGMRGAVMRVTVFRTVPPLIVGTCGVVPNPDFDAFEERLDELEATGVVVERRGDGGAVIPSRSGRK